MSADTRAILLNRDAIAVDQDALGKQADRRWKAGDAEVWSRPLADGSWAVGVFNRGARARTVRFEWTEAGLPGRPLAARDLWSGEELRGELSGEYSGEVAGHGVVLLRVRF
jgi:alpha-galactosidase